MMPLQSHGLPLPPLLLALIAQERWQHPGDTHLHAILPWINDPLDLVVDFQRRSFAVDCAMLTQMPRDAAFMHLACGSLTTQPILLPWIDLEQVVWIMVNREVGDDQAVALDYRTSRTDPRVIASHWVVKTGCCWREVTPTFSSFVQQLDL